ncbi:uncharacterized protein N7477_009086 [Penicillium maclennaniae]|uniref:uncharacterized protein n=1 Tax=Penicillium maclennaniae TaxID=1343394 RepID=UPI00254107C8|nr:uncharacterized protein N7477_009086 [Penicillium maclennaniae]KAJ5661470.1 hypothetical protein N7477_009086 [Penicillium maclennaniae]
MYVFEKILTFELAGHDILTDPKEQFQCAAISLANMLHEMQERSARAWRREECLPQSVVTRLSRKRSRLELVTLLDD